ncbi:MAG: SMC family ATPase [Desulfosporosinus sp.]|nr:SMC family ATPase [Desulfosporosinus sp.]
MRIDKISLQNFRCFRQAEIDLSADIVAVYGRNGVGKTAIFDALEYALLGSVGRFSTDVEAPPNYLSNILTDGKVDIRVNFKGKNEQWLEVTQERGKNDPVIASSGGWTKRRDLLYGLLVDENYSPPRREVEPINELFRSTLLLSQDSIRHFIEGNSSERSRVLAAIAGSAYFQRCLDKVKDILEEIVIRDKKAKLRSDEIQKEASELAAILSEKDARIKTIKERLGTEVVSIEQVKDALDNAGICKDISETNLEEFVSAIKGVYIERSSNLEDQSKRLAGLSEMARQHPDRVERKNILLEKVLTAKTTLIDLEKQEKYLIETIRTYEKNIKELKINLAEISNRYQALQELPNLKRQRKDLLSSQTKLSSDIDGVRKQLDLGRSKADFAQEEVNKVKMELEQYQSTNIQYLSVINRLDSLRISFPTYIVAKEQILQCEIQINMIHEQRKSLKEKAEVLQNNIGSQNQRINELEKELSNMKVDSEEYSKLITKLKYYATSEICPLCGFNHLSSDALLDSIAKQLKSIPSKLQEITYQLQEYTFHATSLNTDLITIYKQIQQRDEEAQKLSLEREERTKFIQSIDTVASIVGIEMDLSVINEWLMKYSILITEVQNNLRYEEAVLNNKNTLLAEAVILIESKETLYTSSLERLEKTKDLISKLENRLIELGLKDEISLLDEQISQKCELFSKDLADLEVRKDQQETLKIETQEELTNIRLKQKSFEGDLQQWEQYLSRLAIEIEDFNQKCTSVDLPPETAFNNIIGRQEGLNQSKNLLSTAMKIVERYELSRRAIDLDNERSELQNKYEPLTSETQKSKESVIKLRQAHKDASEWMEALTRGVNHAVEERISRHQPEIFRLFKGMIPSPFLFENITMKQSDDGLVLGLRYRGQDMEAGEPRFFLSSAQANVLALAIFISLAMGQKWSTLDTILLDDPVQHLDDLDVVAFLDNIRAAAAGKFGVRKQIIISTCNQNLYLLMIKKFRLLESMGLHFRAISLLDNGIGGPIIKYDVGAPEGYYLGKQLL